MAGVNINPGSGRSSIAFGEKTGAVPTIGMTGTTPPAAAPGPSALVIIVGVALVGLAAIFLARKFR